MVLGSASQVTDNLRSKGTSQMTNDPNTKSNSQTTNYKRIEATSQVTDEQKIKDFNQVTRLPRIKDSNQMINDSRTKTTSTEPSSYITDNQSTENTSHATEYSNTKTTNLVTDYSSTKASRQVSDEVERGNRSEPSSRSYTTPIFLMTNTVKSTSPVLKHDFREDSLSELIEISERIKSGKYRSLKNNSDENLEGRRSHKIIRKSSKFTTTRLPIHLSTNFPTTLLPIAPKKSRVLDSKKGNIDRKKVAKFPFQSKSSFNMKQEISSKTHSSKYNSKVNNKKSSKKKESDLKLGMLDYIQNDAPASEEDLSIERRRSGKKTTTLSIEANSNLLVGYADDPFQVSDILGGKPRDVEILEDIPGSFDLEVLDHENVHEIENSSPTPSSYPHSSINIADSYSNKGNPSISSNLIPSERPDMSKYLAKFRGLNPHDSSKETEDESFPSYEILMTSTSASSIFTGRDNGTRKNEVIYHDGMSYMRKNFLIMPIYNNTPHYMYPTITSDFTSIPNSLENPGLKAPNDGNSKPDHYVPSSSPTPMSLLNQRYPIYQEIAGSMRIDSSIDDTIDSAELAISDSEKDDDEKYLPLANSTLVNLVDPTVRAGDAGLPVFDRKTRQQKHYEFVLKQKGK